MHDIYYLFFSFFSDIYWKDMLFCTCYGFVSVLHSILLFKVSFKLEMPFLKIKKYLFSLYSSMVKWMLTLKIRYFFMERVLESKHCYVLFLLHKTELLLLSYFHLCKSLLWIFLPQIIEVVSTKYAFFLSSFFPRKDLLSVRNLLVSVGFPSETSFFLSKILTHENFRSFYFFKLICLLPQTWLVDIT